MQRNAIFWHLDRNTATQGSQKWISVYSKYEIKANSCEYFSLLFSLLDKWFVKVYYTVMFRVRY